MLAGWEVPRYPLQTCSLDVHTATRHTTHATHQPSLAITLIRFAQRKCKLKLSTVFIVREHEKRGCVISRILHSLASSRELIQISNKTGGRKEPMNVYTPHEMRQPRESGSMDGLVEEW